MARSARLVVKVVLVAAAGAAEARRRVADVLLRAATTRRVVRRPRADDRGLRSFPAAARESGLIPDHMATI